MGWLDLLTRAAAGRELDLRAPRSMPGGTPTPGTPGYNNGKRLRGLGQMPVGNVLWANSTGQASGPVKAATVGTRYNSPGQPMEFDWDAYDAIEGAYFGSQWVYRCVRTIADTAAMLPIKAGLDPKQPRNHNVNAPLARLIGPPPGTPNPTTSSRAFISWSLTQYLVTGRCGWEAQLDPARKGHDGNPLIVALWPLVTTALRPVPKLGGTGWWDSFWYETATGRIPLPAERVIYTWRPSQRDWRQAESCLESARKSLQVLMGIETTMWNLVKNGLVGQHIVVSPPFEEPAMRRAWQDQFMQEFGGMTNAGKTIFAEAEIPDSGARLPNVQVTPLSTNPVDAQLLQIWQQAKVDVTVDLGVPESLVGNASQRTYANADSEYRNFWTVTMLDLLREQEDNINTMLAPRLGDEVAWFDVSEVVALQPPSLFPQLDPVALIQAGVTTPQQIAAYLNLPALTSYEEAPETAPLGEEAINATSMSRSQPQLDRRRQQRNLERRVRDALNDPHNKMLAESTKPRVSSLAQVAEMLERQEVANKVGTKRIDEIEKWMSRNEDWLEKAANEEVLKR